MSPEVGKEHRGQTVLQARKRYRGQAVSTTDGVAAPDEPLSADRFAAIEDRVAEIYGTRNDIVLMQGEAVLGLEAAARSVIRPGMRCLNLVSGLYGKWFGSWIEEFGGELIELEVGYDDAVDPADVERALEANPGIELLAVVHAESLTGNVNPLGEIGVLAKRYGAMTIADVVASIGGQPVRPDEWNLDICVGGPHKCLGGSPGVSLMAVSEDAWTAIQANPHSPRNSFLSMLDWKEKWLDKGRRRVNGTPAVAEMLALEAACAQRLEEGVEAALERHRRVSLACRTGVREMGLELWSRSDELATAAVTTVKVPQGLDGGRIATLARERFRAPIEAGFGDLSERLVRIDHMGPTAEPATVIAGLAALGQVVRGLGSPVRIGAGVEAALSLLSAEAG